MTPEERLERLRKAYSDARAHGLAHSQREFAARLGMNATTISSAMNGHPRILTDSLVLKAENFVQGLDEGKGQSEQSSPDLQTITFTKDEISAMLQHLARTVDSQQETIAALTGVHEKKEDATFPTVLRR